LACTWSTWSAWAGIGTNHLLTCPRTAPLPLVSPSVSSPAVLRGRGL
jgi:hypothetical protein